MGPLQAITKEDRHQVKRYILLPLVIRAFERDRAILEQHIKTPEPYMEAIDNALRAVREDLRSVKRHFFNAGIKVVAEYPYDEGLKAEYLCRGYKGDMHLRWEFISAQASIHMRKYLGVDITPFIAADIPEWLKEEY